jgi:hypothetical protein
MKLCTNALFLVVLSTFWLPIATLSADCPQQASKVGFTLKTFASKFSANNVCTTDNTCKPFQWYPWNFFGGKTNTGSITLNNDGSVTLADGAISTAAPANTSAKFRGTAFGGGGFFEASLKFDPETVVKQNFHGWPAWWSMAIEHLAGLPGESWQGQSKEFRHFIEVDFFEYDLKGTKLDTPPHFYGAGMHDCFGVWNAKTRRFNKLSTPTSELIRRVPPKTNFTKYHLYGFLWVPATATSAGIAQYYFDRKQVGATTYWNAFNDKVPPPAPPWTFSVIDRNHLVLVLGSGANEPMTVRSVNVWQSTPAGNLTVTE